MLLGNTIRSKRKKGVYIPPPASVPLNATDWTVVGAPVVTHGATGGTSVAAALPVVSGGVQAGDCILAFCSSRLQNTMVVPPAGNKWHREKQSIHNNGGNGGNVGATMGTTFWTEAEGTVTGPITFLFPEPEELPAGSLISVNVLSVMLMVIRKGTPAPGTPAVNWDIEIVAAYHRNWNEAVNAPSAIVCKGINKQHLVAGDQVLFFSSSNSSAFNMTAKAGVFNGALTVATQTQDLFGSSTTNGNDQYIYGSHFKITAGEAIDYVTATATANGTPALRAPWVVTHIVRVRQSNVPMEYRAGAFDWINPADIANGDGAASDNHGGIWASMRKEQEGIATYGIETYLGEPHFTIVNDFTNWDWATFGERNRRGEIIHSTWLPCWMPGVKLFDSYRLRWAAMPNLGDQFVIYQNHPGRWSGATGSNSPIAALEFCKANQYTDPIGYSGVVPAGSLILSMAAAPGSNTNSYFYVPGVNYIGNDKDIPIEVYIKFGLVGSSRFVLAMAGEIKLDITTVPTIAALPEHLGDNDTVGTGSFAMVGGQTKMNTYLHQMPSSGDPTVKMKQYRDAFVNAGLPPQIKSYIKGFKRSIKHPNDYGYDDAYDMQTLQQIIIT